MPESVHCPDCGHDNPPGSASCEVCNFPLQSDAAPPTSPEPAVAPAPIEASLSPRAVRPIRPRRPRPQANLSLSIWLMVGTVCALAAAVIGVKGYWKTNFTPVEGANPGEQQFADSLHAVLAKDSTNVAAQTELGNVLYDTKNWAEAVQHYRVAVALDSSRASTLVDLGVCYFNLGNAADAERSFQLALQRDPHQPVALFNLGIVAESAEDYPAALQYFHRAMESSPPDEMRQPLTDRMTAVMKKMGKSAPPLPETR